MTFQILLSQNYENLICNTTKLNLKFPLEMHNHLFNNFRRQMVVRVNLENIQNPTNKIQLSRNFKSMGQ